MSGAVTLGGFAKNWRISRVGYSYSIQLGKMLQPERQLENDDEVPYLKSQHVQAGVIFSDDLPHMWANLTEISKYGVRVGDLLVCEGGDVGRAAMAVHVPEDAIIQNALHRVRSSGGNSLSYLLYVLLHIKNHGWFDIICNKSTIAHLTREKLSALAIPLPPPLVQQSIAAHLDRETAKIDTLIAKKRELIAKLKEQRSALISRTVTRGLPPEAAQAAGLDPNPSMKDSGVEWFGKVPEHWNCLQLKRLVTFMTSGSRGWAEYYADSGSVFVRIGNLTRDSLDVDMSDIQYVAPPLGAEGERTSVKPGDLLISITAYLGSIAIAPVDFADGYVSQHIALARPAAKQLWSRFGGYCVLSEPIQVQLNAQGYGGTKVQLSLGDVLCLWLPAPPVEEQRLISEFLDTQVGKLALLMEKIKTAITRLTEYRAALITAAVTGQLAIAPGV